MLEPVATRLQPRRLRLGGAGEEGICRIGEILRRMPEVDHLDLGVPAQELPIPPGPVGQPHVPGLRVRRLDPGDLPLHPAQERRLAVLRRGRHVDGVLPLPGLVIKADGADHRLPPAPLAHQEAGAVHPEGDRRRRFLQFGQGILPALLPGQRHGGHRIGDVLHEAAGHLPAVVLGQVLDHPGRAELGVLEGDHLGELGGGTADDPGVAVQRAVGPARLLW